MKMLRNTGADRVIGVVADVGCGLWGLNMLHEPAPYLNRHTSRALQPEPPVD